MNTATCAFINMVEGKNKSRAAKHRTLMMTVLYTMYYM